MSCINTSSAQMCCIFLYKRIVKSRRLCRDSPEGQCTDQTSIFHTVQGHEEPDPLPACTGRGAGKHPSQVVSPKTPNERAVVNVFDRDAWRSQPTIVRVMCCQVAWQLDRWCWYFTLANHKTRTQQGFSGFAEMIFQPELSSVTEPGVYLERF